ncbi:MAG: hypothetical protein VYD19_11240 [Myxococcota bacterium]|nr:hypothetical protein [Myxococcota bacterium]
MKKVILSLIFLILLLVSFGVGASLGGLGGLGGGSVAALCTYNEVALNQGVLDAAGSEKVALGVAELIKNNPDLHESLRWLLERDSEVQVKIKQKIDASAEHLEHCDPFIGIIRNRLLETTPTP